MMVCYQCNGTGQNQNLSYLTNPAGTAITASGGQTCPPTNQIQCTGCQGTGKYNSFGASEAL